MNEKRECCGTCEFHCYDSETGDWYCDNCENEDTWGDWTDYSYACEEWQGR